MTDWEDREQPGGGTAAMLQGLITMLGEVLDRLDRRLDSTEASLTRLQPERLDRFLQRLDRRVESVTRTEAVVARLEERELATPSPEPIEPEAIARLEANMQASIEAGQAVATTLEAAVERLEQLSAAVEDGAAGMGARLEALERMRDDHAAILNRLDDLEAGLHSASEAVSDLARAMESLHSLLSSHVEDSAASLGQRATKAGRKLVEDLGIRSRTRRSRGTPGRPEGSR